MVLVLGKFQLLVSFYVTGKTGAVSAGVLTHPACFQHTIDRNLSKVYQYESSCAYANDAFIGETYSATFITCKLTDCLINEFPIPSCTLDICLTHCIFLKDLSVFMNFTPPFVLITSGSFLPTYMLYGWLQNTPLNNPWSTSLVYAGFECRRAFAWVLCCHQGEWHGLPSKAYGDEFALCGLFEDHRYLVYPVDTKNRS